MGYYTSFTMTTDGGDDGAINNYLVNQIWHGTIYALEYDNDHNWYASDTQKWYEHDSDMKELSKQFPEVLFTLTGEGEDTGDVWRTWYRGGEIISEWALDVTIPTNPDWLHHA